MSKKNTLTKLQKNPLPFLIFLALIIVGYIFWSSKNRVYINSEYNYKFTYPKSAELEFISSLKGNTDISTADTIAVMVKPQVSLRFQIIEKPNDTLSNAIVKDSIQLGKNRLDYIDVQALCNYLTSNEKVYLCLLTNPDLNIIQLQNNQTLINLFKSIEFF